MAEQPRKEHLGDPLNLRVFIHNKTKDHAALTPSIVPLTQAIKDGKCLLLDTGEFKENQKYLVILDQENEEKQKGQIEQKISLVGHGEFGKVQRTKSTLIPIPACQNCGVGLKAMEVDDVPENPHVGCPNCGTLNSATADPVIITEDVAIFGNQPFQYRPDEVWSQEETRNVSALTELFNPRLKYMKQEITKFIDRSNIKNPKVQVFDLSAYNPNRLRGLFIQTEDLKTEGKPNRIINLQGEEIETPSEDEYEDKINIFKDYSQTSTSIDQLHDLHEIKAPNGKTLRFLTEWEDEDRPINIIINARELVQNGWIILGTFDPTDPEQTYDDLNTILRARNRDILNRKKSSDIETETSFEYITVAVPPKKGGLLPWQVALKASGISAEDDIFIIASIPNSELACLTISHEPKMDTRISD